MSETLLKVNNVQKNNQHPIIKVIGVGGGGGNAVNYMYSLRVPDVTYLLCNTDRQHLNSCDVPDTICLGEKTSKGLGAGNRPELARQAALESQEEIINALSDGTQMVFITAGMGGGTGTGAAPVIARIAKDLGILTVGIVTIPFLFEGRTKILRAIEGVEELGKNVDAILVVKNELLKSVYPDLSWTEAFRKADETLTTSTRSISELVTIPGLINVDFADVNTTLKDGGVSIITRGYATAEEGIEVAMERAMQSPLVNADDFDKAQRVLFQITFREGCEPKADVTETLKNNITSRLTTSFDLIWGITERNDDGMLGDVGFTLLASGFTTDDMHLDDYLLSKPKTKEEQEREERDDEAIRDWYPEYEKAGMGRVRYQTVVLTDLELDDDLFISAMIETPTLKRRGSDVREWRARRGDARPRELHNTAAQAQSYASPTATAELPEDGIERSDEVIKF